MNGFEYIARILKDEGIVPFYVATAPHSYVGWGKTAHLGFSIPLMTGAKLAVPERFCPNLMGDAAFGMSGLDIETAVRAGLGIGQGIRSL